MPIPVEPSIENQPVIVDSPSRDLWGGLNPCLKEGLNGEFINVCEIQNEQKKNKQKESKCYVQPIDFGKYTRDEYLDVEGFPIMLYPHSMFMGYSHNGDISIDEKGYKYIWLSSLKLKFYFVKCPVLSSLSSDFTFSGYLSSWDNFRENYYKVSNEGKKLVLNYGNSNMKFVSYLSQKCPDDLVDKDYFEVVDDDTETDDINKNLGTTGITGDTSDNGTNGTVDNVGGLQGRGGEDDDEKQLGNGQNWYMFLIPILLWFYKKKVNN